MNMNASESGLFKVLMWTVTTLMGLVTIGIMAILTITIDTNRQMQSHLRDQDKQDAYYVSRIYTDSMNINTLFVHINELNQILRLHATEEYEAIKSASDYYIKTKLEATLPRNKYKPKPLND